MPAFCWLGLRQQGSGHGDRVVIWPSFLCSPRTTALCPHRLVPCLVVVSDQLSRLANAGWGRITACYHSVERGSEKYGPGVSLPLGPVRS